MIYPRKRTFALVLAVAGAVWSPAVAAEPLIELEARLSPDRIIPGEPVTLEVILSSPEVADGTPVVTSQHFLSVSLQTPERFMRDPFKGCGLREEPYSAWCGRLIILDSNQREWRFTRDVSHFGLWPPGEFEVIVTWETAPLDELGRSRAEVQIGKTHPGVKPIFVENFNIEKRLKLSVHCPSDAVDRGAYELLAGGSCPASVLVGAVRRQHADRLEELVARYPTSTYAGYWLARLGPILPGVGDDPEDKVAQLTAPEFLTHFPRTYLRENPPPEGPWVPMEKTVRERAEVMSRFLDAHPGFPLRESIEKQLGDLELVLGNYDRAYAAFRWLAANAKERPEWPAGMVAVMEKQGLAKPDEER